MCAKVISRNPTKKFKDMTLSEKYIHVKNIYGLAEGQMGFIREILNIQLALTIMNFVMLYWPNIAKNALVIMPIGIVAYVIFNLILGTILDKKIRIVDTEKNWQNVRNPEIMDIYHIVKRLEEKIRRIEAKMP